MGHAKVPNQRHGSIVRQARQPRWRGLTTALATGGLRIQTASKLEAQGTICGYPIMPSLLRFLFFVGLIVGLGYAALFSLANFVKLHPREIVVTVPPNKFVKQE
jgi:hypothetical protein